MFFLGSKISILSQGKPLKRIRESENNLIRGNQHIIVKKYRKRNNFEQELHALEKLGDFQGKFLPRILWVDADQKMIVFNKIEGFTLDKIREVSDKKQILQQILAFFHTIHSISSGVSNLDFSSFYKKKYYRYYQQAKKNPFINSEELATLYHQVLPLFSSLQNKQIVLLHGDFWVKNILINTNEVTGILDFEHSYYGPIFFEGLKILRDYEMITKEECEDTSSAEQNFMYQLIEYLLDQYPIIFDYTPVHYTLFYGVEYFKKLALFKKSWYQHSQTFSLKENLNIALQTL